MFVAGRDGGEDDDDDDNDAISADTHALVTREHPDWTPLSQFASISGFRNGLEGPAAGRFAVSSLTYVSQIIFRRSLS